MNNVQFSSMLVLVVCMSTNTLQDSGYKGSPLAFQRSLLPDLPGWSNTGTCTLTYAEP